MPGDEDGGCVLDEIRAPAGVWKLERSEFDRRESRAGGFAGETHASGGDPRVLELGGELRVLLGGLFGEVRLLGREPSGVLLGGGALAVFADGSVVLDLHRRDFASQLLLLPQHLRLERRRRAFPEGYRRPLRLRRFDFLRYILGAGCERGVQLFSLVPGGVLVPGAELVEHRN